MEVPDRIIQQIVALQNMTVERGATEAEATTAMQKMQALLFKYNLDLSSLDLHKKSDGPGFKEEFEPTIQRKNRNPGSGFKQRSPNLTDYEREWRVRLAVSVAQYNFCRVLTDQEFYHVLFIGSQVNVEAVRSIWDYACEQVDALSYEALKARRKNKTQQALEGFQSGKTWRRDWMFGCVDRLSSRLYEGWAALQKQSEVGTALVVSNTAALAEYVKERSSGDTVSWSNKKRGFGYAHGYRAADRVNLGRNPARLS